MKILKFFAKILPLLVFNWLLVPVYGYDTLLLESKLRSMQSAQEPEYFDGKVILSYKVDRPVRFVGVRFAHEDYKLLHVYEVNQHRVFFLVYSIPSDHDFLKYRIVVDGLWMSDPFNSLTLEGGLLDVDYSILKIETQPEKIIRNPVFSEWPKICFTYHGLPGKLVFIVGDFNNWDPYVNQFVEDSQKPGDYSVCIRVGPGSHFYRFVVDGNPIPDPYNPNRVRDADRRLVSFFEIAK